MTPDLAWRELCRSAAAPYRGADSFAWHYARSKFGRDPLYRGLVEHGLAGEGRVRVLDLGCGQGLVASLLAAMSAQRSAGEWPAAWPAPPFAIEYTGVEMMSRDVARALVASAHLACAPHFIDGDMRSVALPACDLVVLFDVLHYVDEPAQESVLSRARDALRPRGRLLLRVGDASRRPRFALSQWVDRKVTQARGHRVAPTWGRTLEAWSAMLSRLGFSVQSLPMSRGTPFANVLIVADLAPA